MEELYLIKKRVLKDKIFKIVTTILSYLSIIPLFLILYYIFIRGIRYINFRFLTSTAKPMGEIGGGILHSIVGTLILIIIASIIAIPIGVLTGIFISEFKKFKFTNIVKIFVDTLQGIPSIVIGLIGYIWIVIPMKSFSALSGGIALSIIMLPIVIKATEEVIDLIPNEIKEAAYALGAPYNKIVFKILIPYARVGILTGILLGASRIMGETAPLLFTAFGNQYLNFNIFKPISSLPQTIYIYATSPFKEWHNQAFATSTLLIIIVLSINLFGRFLEKRWKR